MQVTKRTAISLPDDLFREIERARKRTKKDRSTWLREAASEYLKRRSREEEIEAWLSAYERIPLNVVGDGRSTVRRLLAKKQKRFAATGRDTIVRAEDLRIADNLKRQGLTMRSVIPQGEKIYLLDNANLSSGGDALDVTKIIHPRFKKIAVRLTEDMGLRICGVDLMVDGDITEKPFTYWVLEVNAAPGLDHYAKTGKVQERIVEDMYRKVLKAME